MKEVSVSMWEVTPEEAINLPKGTQLIEYCRFTKRLAIKRSDHCLYDYLCVYLLAVNPKELTAGGRSKSERSARREAEEVKGEAQNGNKKA